MKKIAIALCLFAGCTDHENLGDTAAVVPTPSRLLDHPRWALTFGGVDDDGAHSVTIDPAGDVIAAGYIGNGVNAPGFTTGIVDFGGTTLHGGGWVSKRAAADGAELWTLGFATSDPASAEPTDVGTAADGSVYVTGVFEGDLSLEMQVLHAPLQNCFLAKFDGAGHLLWARTITPTGDQAFSGNAALGVANDGRVAVVGVYRGTLALPNGDASVTEVSPFVMMFDADGQTMWGATGTTNATAMSVVMTDEDDAIVDGDVFETATFAGTAVRATGLHAQFASRFAADGTVRWTRLIAQHETGPIAFDSAGALVATSRVFPDPQLGSIGGLPEIASLDFDGLPTWRTESISGSARVDAVTVLDDRTIVTAGEIDGTQFDPGTGDLTGCLYLAAHDASGTLIASRSLGDRSLGCVYTIPWKLASSSHSFAFAGRTNVPLDLGTGMLPYVGASDVMIAVFDRD